MPETQSEDGSPTFGSGPTDPADAAATAQLEDALAEAPAADAASTSRSLLTALTTAAGAARRVHQRSSVVAARLLSEERVTIASRKVTTALVDERTKALLAASARAGARVAADVLSSRGSEQLASAVRAFVIEAPEPAASTASTSRVEKGADALPSNVPTVDDIATLLAARRADRSRRAVKTASGGMAAWPADTPPAAPQPHPTVCPYPTRPIEVTIGPQNSFWLERHPELSAFTVEVSPTGGREYVLSIEWKGVASRFWFELNDLPKQWQRVEHEGIALPLQLRRTGPTTAGVSFLDPGASACAAEASRRETAGSMPPAPSAGAMSAALRRAHDDSMAVIRNLRA